MDRSIARKYFLRRKKKKIASIVALIGGIGVTILSILAFLVFQVDRFTIATNDSELCLTIDEDKSNQTTILAAPPLLNAADTQYSDIPETIDVGLGSKNDDHYFAYSFYLGGVNPSEDIEIINYSLSFTLDKVSNEIENAMKILIIRNNVRQVYAKADENGNPKPIYKGEDHTNPSEIIGVTIPFEDNTHIIWRIYSIKPGNYDKFTIVMWIDGWESVNSMKGGVFQANLKFSTESKINKEKGE